MRRMCSPCCANAVSGHAVAEPTIPLMKSRRRIASSKGSRAPTSNRITAGICDQRNGAESANIAFLRPPFSDTDGLNFVPLVQEPIVIVFSAWHSLAHSKSAPLSALAQERNILFTRTLNPAVYDAIVAAIGRAGFSPQLAQEAPQMASAIPMVAAGLGVTLVPQSMSRLHPEDVVFIPIEGLALSAEISLAWRRAQRSAAVKNFVSVARRQAQITSAAQ